ncbi:hypothetical protein GGI21_000007 [Coemansia aciculifera]|nr:hypothetical protein GGI21_000007 [Coemansia aciculifera]
MPIFGQTNKRASSHIAASGGGSAWHQTPTSGSNPFERKSIAASLSSSVKTLFTKRIPSIIISDHPPPPPTVVVPRPQDSTTTTHPTKAEGEDEDRYSQARARVLAETARRLHQQQPVLPATPSSIGTGKTLSVFLEEDEDESSDTGVSYELSAVARAGISRFASGGKSNSRLSLRTGRSSRPASMATHASSCSSSPTATVVRPQSLLLGYESHTQSSSTLYPAAHMDDGGCDYESSNKQGAGGSGYHRYSVAMSQSLSRRFQTRLAHEYEQRIYCLHSHYADMIERMEARARQDSERCRQLEKQVLELQKKADIAATHHQKTEFSTMRFMGGGGVSKKLVEFVDHYQDEVQRLMRDTSTAQEWVVTLAELVIGPKQEHQSWDEWLNICLETLQGGRK